MGGSLGLFGKFSLGLVIFATLAMMTASPIGGFIIGCILFMAWAGCFRLYTFVQEGKGCEFIVDPKDPHSTGAADGYISPSMRENSRVLGGASPARNVEHAANRVIGADARRRVVCAKAAADRDNAARDSESPGSEDRDFADFLRSLPC